MSSHVTADQLDTDRLAEVVGSLPRKQRELGHVLLERPELFAFGTLATLERLLGISGITVIRFSKRLGFSGYQELQSAVRNNFLQRSGFRFPAGRALDGGRPGDAVAATVEQHRANLSATLDGLDLEGLNGVADAIESASRVLVCGSGAATFVAQLLVRLLRHVGLRGEAIEQTGVDEVLALYDVGPQDVVVGVAFWLSFGSTLSTLHLARSRGALTVAIVGSPVSPLAREATITLHAPAQGTALPFSSVGPVALVECLAAVLAGRRPERAQEIRDELHSLYVEEELIAATTSDDGMS